MEVNEIKLRTMIYHTMAVVPCESCPAADMCKDSKVWENGNQCVDLIIKAISEDNK